MQLTTRVQGGCDGTASTATKPQNKVEDRTSLYVVIPKRAAILELLACKDYPLLVGREALLFLDRGLDAFDCVIRLATDIDRLSCQCIDFDPHRTESEGGAVQGNIDELLLACVHISDLFLRDQGRRCVQDLI